MKMKILEPVAYITILLVGIYFAYRFNSLVKHLPVPEFNESYWGVGAAGEFIKDDPEVYPFTINISQDILTDLKLRLNSYRLTPSLEGAKQHYGVNSAVLTDVISFWKLKYNWRKQEKILNKFPQFTTQVQGIKLHFLHIVPEKRPGIVILPLLLLHGWPGSFKEFHSLIPLLTTPTDNLVFELVIPSLPGYGFSEATTKPGLGATELAILFKNLMLKLNYEKFYIQGGDWGSVIASDMATLFPSHVLGVHSNMCYIDTLYSNLKWLTGSIYPPVFVTRKYANRLYPLTKIISNIFLESGYMHIQATKPDTIGAALNDSPVGLAAYILEKFITWTDPTWKDLQDGGLESRFKYEDLLDNVMIYWVTGSITTSMRLYAETLNKKNFLTEMNRVPVYVPYACAKFRHEIFYRTDNMLQDKYTNLVHSKEYDVGGHFPAFEIPHVLAYDIFEAFGKMQN